MPTPDKTLISAQALQDLDVLRHGFFTRQGGVSSGIYASLNCGLGSRDHLANVQENRARVAETLGLPPERLITASQSHTAETVIANKAWESDRMPKADAIVTSTPGLAIAVMTADCVPVLLCDPQARVIGAAHAGWKGALSGIGESVVEAMVKLGAVPERIEAAIGPAISQRAYEVGADYVERFLAEDAGAASFFAIDEGSGEPHFDLTGYVAERLARAGVTAINDLGLCTYCDETRFFSYRRSQHHGEDDYGRQISAIVLT